MTSEHAKSNGRPVEVDPLIAGPAERSELIPSSSDMPRLIVLDSIHRVPKALRAKVEGISGAARSAV